MTFSPEWNDRYSENTHLSVWPWADVISNFHRHAKPFNSQTKVLEIGFGAGANIPFFRSISVDYSGIEGSAIIHNQVLEKYPEIAQKLYLGDFLTYKFPEKYDVIIDRASMTHNSTAAIKKGLSHLSNILKPEGKYIGIDWFSTEHSDFKHGQFVDDFTRNKIGKGQFTGVGNVHFSTQEHLVSLFEEVGLSLSKLELKKNHTVIPEESHVFASWNLVANKNNNCW